MAGVAIPARSLLSMNALFACRPSKVESHCLHHMLPSRRACTQVMALRPRGYSFDVPPAVYE